MERTLILLKPDAVQRFLMGRILSRFEEKGLQIVAAKFLKIPLELCRKHYEVHKGKPFYDGLVKYMTSSPVLALVLEGQNAVAVCRKMMGKTFGYDAEPGTIRGDFAISKPFNLIHGSDSPESSAKEIALFFKLEEIHAWEPASLGWIYDLREEGK
jgi:nucleoside-diphosphate kinase